jgi:hypothetical protein
MGSKTEEIIKKTVFVHLEMMIGRYSSLSAYSKNDVRIIWISGEPNEKFLAIAEFEGDYGRRIYVLTYQPRGNSIVITDHLVTHREVIDVGSLRLRDDEIPEGGEKEWPVKR